MTVYYIDPSAGDDSATGLSWAQAWRTLRGLRVASVTPGAGDEIRFAKSVTYTPVMGEYTRDGGEYLNWYFRGAEVLNTYQADTGLNQFQYWQSPDTDLVVLKCWTAVPVNGAMVIDVPVWANNSNSLYETVHAVSNDGAYLLPNQLLFGGSMLSLSASTAQGFGKLQGAVRCHVPYAGAGDVDLPSGAVEVTLYNGTTQLLTIPLPVIRNSADEWTPFEIDFTPWPFGPLGDLQVRFTRSSVPVSRDTSPFGLEFSQFILTKPTGIGSTETILSVARSSFWGTPSPEIVGTNDMRVALERINACDREGSNSAYSADFYYSNRLAYEVSEYVRCFKVFDIAMTGRLPLSLPGTLGVYDLNGSLGGSAGSPLKITGGWDTATDVMDGLSAFSAGLPHQFGSSFAWLDLHEASNVRIENIAAAYGFGSLISRPGKVILEKCMLPFSLKPAFGVVDINSHVTLESMYVCPMVLEGFGTMGDFSLKNVYYVSQRNTTAERRNEVGDFGMNNSHFSPGHAVYGSTRPTYIRGNGVLEQCTLIRPPKLVSIAFGHTLVFRNHKGFSATGAAFLIPTAPESRWDHIDYEDASLPFYNFGTLAPTGATCDAKVTMFSSMLIVAGQYPTGLRGNRTLNIFTDGLNDFMSSTKLSSSDDSDRGYLYSHMAHRTESDVTETALSLRNMGDVAAPNWSKEQDRDTAEITYAQTPRIAPTSRVFLAEKFANVLYRTDDTLYVMSGRGGTSFAWTVLKAIYLPKAGAYRAHFGCMVENLNTAPMAAAPGCVAVPLEMYEFTYPQHGSEVLLGRIGVFSNAMTSLYETQDYLSASVENALAGLGGNLGRDQWRDFYVDFDMSSAGLVEMRHGSDDSGLTNTTIFDILEIYERP